MRITNGHASSGGGIANTGGTLTIERSLIDRNAADIGGADGGGLLNFGGGTLVVRNSTIAGNTAVQAGALNTWGGPRHEHRLQHVTVIGNHGDVHGGAQSQRAGGDILRLRNSIVAGNTAGSGGRTAAQPAETRGYNVSDTTECGLTTGTDRQDVEVRQGERAREPRRRHGRVAVQADLARRST